MLSAGEMSRPGTRLDWLLPLRQGDVHHQVLAGSPLLKPHQDPEGRNQQIEEGPQHLQPLLLGCQNLQLLHQGLLHLFVILSQSYVRVLSV
uniref:Uncharacterized protein n=1 Tax=Arundo donax TaxID=35708 RepID=A0A0A9GZD7_ARUDO